MAESQNLVQNTSEKSQLESQLEGQSDRQLERQSEKEYYQLSLKDGYRGILGAITGTLAAELILWFGQTDNVPLWMADFKLLNDNMPLIFVAVGVMFTLRHVAQIWQAKIQLKQLSLDD